MRLLQVDENGEFSLTDDMIDNIPPYAILSHTWGEDHEEVSFKELNVGPRKTKPGYKKLRFCAEQAARDGLQHFWIDTCCIDKSNSVELQEAITSMFRWYKDAAKCYVYLSDVSIHDWEVAFRTSRWFTRGWTLQELLAPTTVEFFSLEAKRLGDKRSLEHQITETTKLPVSALQGTPLSSFSVEERMSWSKTRQTKRPEDMAYSLLGIFNVYMPLIYGEGTESALRRLQTEIDNRTAPTNQRSGRDSQTASILNRLPIAEDASFNSYNKQDASACLPKTRVDLLRFIYSSIEGEDRQCIFWLNGLAGTGKSTIARTVARHYFEKTRLAASFFFSRGGGDVGHAGKFVSSIASQIADNIPGLQQYICDAIMKYSDIFTRSLHDQWEQLVLRPLSKLDEDNGRHSFHVVVIDALDECDDDNHVRTIIHLLAKTQLRVFLTSRPEIPIRLGFFQIPDHQGFVLHNISPSIVDHDITVFLEYNLALIKQERSLNAAWPGDEAIKLMVERASGLFIWAATACRFIREGKRFAAKRLDTIIKDDSDNTVTAPEKYLNDIYTTVLRQSVASEYTDEEKEEAFGMLKHVLGSIVILMSPLSISSLSKLIGATKDDVDQTLADLHSILDVPQDLISDSRQDSIPDALQDSIRPLRLHHPSFRDFLLDNTRCTDPNFWVDERLAHLTLAESCIRCMSDSLKQDICDLKAPGTLAADVKTSRINQNIPSEVQYASLYWIQHLQKSSAELRDDDLVHQFLLTHLLHWLETLGLMGKVTEGVYAITLLESILPLKCRNLSALVHDIKRFVLFNRLAIEQAPLQVYSSALIFAPTTSIVKNQFKNYIPWWIRRLPGVDDNWTALQQTLESHTSSVCAVAFSPYGKQLASASEDKTIKIWDAGSGALLQTLEGHSQSVNAVKFSPNGKQLASASSDSTIKLWDAEFGALQQTLEGHSRKVQDVAFSPDGKKLASASNDQTIKLWHSGSGVRQRTLKDHSTVVIAVTFSPDGKQLASASGDGTIKLWDVESGAVQQTLEAHLDWARAVAFSPDGKQLASASDDKTIKLWRVESGALQHTLKSHSSWIMDVAFSPDGKQLVSASQDRTIKLWDAGSGALQQTYKSHSNTVAAVAFSPDGKQLISASADKTIKLWDAHARSGAIQRKLTGHSNWVNAVAFSSDGKQLISASADKKIKIWDAGSSGLLQTLESHSDSVWAFAFSPDSKHLASTSADGTIKIWDAGSMALQQTLKGHSELVRVVVFSPDGKQLASPSDDETIKIWDAGSGALLQTLRGHSRLVVTVTFSPDGKQLASASADSTIKLWDVGSGALQQTLEGHLDWARAVAFSPDGKQLASASDDTTIKLWDFESGALQQTLEGHSNWTMAVAFSPDGKQLASASKDKTIKLWDIGSGVMQQTLNVEASILAVSFSDDGKLLQTDRGYLYVFDRSTSAFFSEPGKQQDIFVSERWLSCGPERVVWLPPEYRPSKVAVDGGVVGFGYESGRVMLMEFNF